MNIALPVPSDLAPGLLIAPGARLGEGVTLGCNAIIHSDVVIGDGCTIGDLAVVGKPPTLHPSSNATGAAPGPLMLDAGATVSTGAIVCAGARIGTGAMIGDQSGVRERVVVGPDTVIGRHCGIAPDVTIGARVRIGNFTGLGGPAVVEDDVFIGPGLLTPNDATAARHESPEELSGPTLRRACRIGAAVVLMPGVEVGEEAFVAAGALVTRDVAPRTVVVGSPARFRREVAEAELLERWR